MAIELKSTIKKEDLAKATALLDRLSWRADNIQGGLKVVGTALLKVQHKRFDSESDPQGKPWAKLAPLSVELRGKKKGKILNRSGDLKQSGNYQISGTSLRVGVNTPYAAVHQYGATITPKNKPALALPFKAGFRGSNKAGWLFAKSVTIPARPIVGFGPEDEKATRLAIENWLKIKGEV